jgi:hypothetical protein
MTQVDLPQLSLQRYVELVKRRRWQLVPVSLFGLVVGGLIAFLIPRYFVAETTIEHNAVPDQQLVPGEQDPFKGIVQSASEQIELRAMDAMQTLKWPEAQIADSYQRTAAEKEVQDRINVFDNNPGNRAYATLKVYYKDLDGQRAKTFCDAVVQAWLQKYISDLREPVDQKHKLATDQVNLLGNKVDLLLAEKQALESKYGFDPTIDSAFQLANFKQRQDSEDKLRLELLKKESEQDKVDLELQRLRERIAELPEFVKADVAQIEDLVKKDPLGVKLLMDIKAERLAMDHFWTQGSKNWHSARRRAEQGEAQLRTLASGGGGEGMVENAVRLKLMDELQAGEKLRLGLAAEVQRLRDETEAGARRLKDLIDGHLLYEKKQRALAEVDALKKSWMEQLQDAEEKLARLDKKPPVRQLLPAIVPPRPTDPNILVVSLIGCVLGLGVAIGLILLLDLLQGTFKTVDDVERGLMVPVLGGVSHLETDEERVASVRGRRRATLVAFAFTGLVVLVVTIFYVAPTRLPPVVRDLLSMLLGK